MLSFLKKVKNFAKILFKVQKPFQNIPIVVGIVYTSHKI